MTINVTSQDAIANFPKLFERVLQGEDIIIADGDFELARVIPSKPQPTAQQPRIPGIDQGQVWMANDFDAPLPEEILQAFEG